MNKKFPVIVSSFFIIYLILYFCQTFNYSKMVFKKRKTNDSTIQHKDQTESYKRITKNFTRPQPNLKTITTSTIKKESNRTAKNNSKSSSNKEQTVTKTIMPAPKKVLTETATKQEEKVRPANCSGCFPHNFNYTILNRNICDVTVNRRVDIFIMIFTHHARFEVRNAIRRTWVSSHRGHNSSVRYAFLLGKSQESELNEKVAKEALLYHDIIMEDFVDTYRNLTYKTMMGLKYASQFCNNTKHVMKADDDMWVNVPRLLVLLEQRKNELKESVVGYCETMRTPLRNSTKSGVSYSMYPHPLYPQFCSGTGYVMELKTGADIYEVSKDIPFFPLEDVFVGFCLQKLGYHVQHWKEFNIVYAGKWDSRLNPCTLKSPAIVTFHFLFNLDAIWRAKCNHTLPTQIPKLE